MICPFTKMRSGSNDMVRSARHSLVLRAEGPGHTKQKLCTPFRRFYFQGNPLCHESELTKFESRAIQT
ncbi:MAG: hypothetical protein B6245_04485 [Desulfobacteraceae bacterium 4572_88]|nr:MAG: hypothetical protein B6245_04485 [Desulfobacteraceae bacterium 4572_88]